MNVGLIDWTITPPTEPGTYWVSMLERDIVSREVVWEPPKAIRIYEHDGELRHDCEPIPVGENVRWWPVRVDSPPCVKPTEGIGYPQTFDGLLAEVYAWQKRTFPTATIYSCAKHLLKEADELLKKPNDPGEYADVYILAKQIITDVELMAAAHKVSLWKAILDKHAVNLERVWGEPDVDGMVEHVREGATC